MAFDGDNPVIVGDDRKDFDPAVADQLTTLILTTAQRNFQLNGASARNQLAASAAGLTLGVQQVNAASLKQITKLGINESGAAADLRRSQDVTHAAILRTGSRVPGS